MRVKAELIKRGAWSQYLEVGIGPDAEIFTKAPCFGGRARRRHRHPSQVGLEQPGTRGRARRQQSRRGGGAALGNDVNLRDFGGRSALLLGKAKDNNASCAIGPFIRLCDEHFGINDIRQTELALRVEGAGDGFVMTGSSSLNKISRDPLELVGHAWGKTHQYPDGFMLFLGTMFAPTQDRHGPGRASPTRLAMWCQFHRQSLASSSTASVTATRSRRGHSASRR